MPGPNVVISGALCSGKTTLARSLVSATGSQLLAVRSIIVELTGASDRQSLQRAGEDLERTTGGRWLLHAAVRAGAGAGIIVDSARTQAQADALRSHFSRLTHFHLHAGEAQRESRYEARTDAADSGLSFSNASANDLEQRVDRLALSADAVIDTTDLPPDKVVRIALLAMR